MHHPTDRITHTTAFVTPVVEHWLERVIAQWVHPMKNRSDDPSHHERTLYLGATSRSPVMGDTYFCKDGNPHELSWFKHYSGIPHLSKAVCGLAVVFVGDLEVIWLWSLTMYLTLTSTILKHVNTFLFLSSFISIIYPFYQLLYIYF